MAEIFLVQFVTPVTIILALFFFFIDTDSCKVTAILARMLTYILALMKAAIETWIITLASHILSNFIYILMVGSVLISIVHLLT